MVAFRLKFVDALEKQSKVEYLSRVNLEKELGWKPLKLEDECNEEQKYLS
jgi:hypothetical protein